ncbi:MAG TPA: hypothetical protein VFT22_38630 [Kofleriaceae bacterium]|nr:hypothetical protein [Kofleriaceae bacterium]
MQREPVTSTGPADATGASRKARRARAQPIWIRRLADCCFDLEAVPPGELETDPDRQTPPLPFHIEAHRTTALSLAPPAR